ncbi:hypothetical protein [Aestuariivivens sediminicola]|uniref:hypothetical protein n=1 Tax=Aestuariivivens sediminicola TaxID=2913560 RepID=UPI001F58887B|nr:hypothetical protein [Aestuariivivens sediminicola]
MREDIILDFFSTLERHYDYAIIHHVDKIFEKTCDIDLVINCNKEDLKRFISAYCLNNQSYYVSHTIDLGVQRFNIIYFNNTEIFKIELDVTYSNKNNLEIDTKGALKRKKTTFIKGKALYMLDSEDEFLYYLRKKVFKKSPVEEHLSYFQKLLPDISENEIREKYKKEKKYLRSPFFLFKYYLHKFFLLYYRILECPSMTISFLGPDGSGKSTIIDCIRANNPFVNFEYYHLKPKKIKSKNQNIQINPHQNNNYSVLLSVLKLIYFIFEYNFYWLINILPKKITPTLIVFDRYFEDIFADPKRYRYGASDSFVKFLKKFIPKPSIHFILEAPVEVIHNRKKEVSETSLKLQLKKYRELGKQKNYYLINANKPVDAIVNDVVKTMLRENTINNSMFYSDGKYVSLPFFKKRVSLNINSLKAIENGLSLYNPYSKKALIFKIFFKRYVLSFRNVFRNFLKSHSNGEFINHLEKVLQMKFTSSIYYPTISDKLILQLLDSNEDIYGYVKIGLNPKGNHKIINEIRGVKEMASRGLLDEDYLIHSGTYYGCEYFLMKPIEGQSAKCLSRRDIDMLLDKLKSNEKFKLREHPGFLKLVNRAKIMNRVKLMEILLDIKNTSNFSYNLVIEHGDFALWNILITNNGLIQLIDFEYYSNQGIEFVDLFNFYFQKGKLILKLEGERLIKYLKDNISLDTFNEMLKVFLINRILLQEEECSNQNHEFELLLKIDGSNK